MVSALIRVYGLGFIRIRHELTLSTRNPAPPKPPNNSITCLCISPFTMSTHRHSRKHMPTCASASDSTTTSVTYICTYVYNVSHTINK